MGSPRRTPRPEQDGLASKRRQRAGASLMILGLLGVAVSAYGVHVERQKHLHGDKYSALCDSARFSCSKVMTSTYGNLLVHHGLVARDSLMAVPNALLGVFAYGLFASYPLVRALPRHEHLYLFAAACSLVLSVYLAYILVVVLRDVCLVCISSYVINILLTWNAVALWMTRGSAKTVKIE